MDVDKILGSPDATPVAGRTEVTQCPTSVAALFTPNTERGGALRFRLFKREPVRGLGTILWAVSESGPWYRGKVERDACGLGCRCGAFLTPTSKAGQRALLTATRIDSRCEPVQP